MGFPALLSEAYEALRRKARKPTQRPARFGLGRGRVQLGARRASGADGRPTGAVSEAAVIEDTRFRSMYVKFDALSHTMDQRLATLSQRFDVLNQPSDRLIRVLDQRFEALNRAMDQRFEALKHAMDQRICTFDHQLNRRFDALDHTIDHRFARVDQQFVARDVRFERLETKTAAIAAMDVWLERLETKAATEFRYLRWGLGIVIALVLGLVTKVILDSPILSLFARSINASHF